MPGGLVWRWWLVFSLYDFISNYYIFQSDGIESEDNMSEDAEYDVYDREGDGVENPVLRRPALTSSDTDTVSQVSSQDMEFSQVRTKLKFL